jgi:hypothetical protein
MSPLFQMVRATRGIPESFRAEQASGSQQPPLPPPNLAEVMARQTELLNLLVQAQQSQQRQQSRGGRDDLNPPVASYQDFLSTQPPFFCKAEEPLDADACLHIIESKFALLTIPCADSSKAYFAAQQLRRAARIWWDNFYAMQPAGHVISWDEFRTAFRAHYIPEGLLERKLNEFLALTQGSKQYCNMHRLLIICANMQAIMQTMTPRNKIIFIVALIPSSRSA